MKAKDQKIIEDAEREGIPIFVLTAKDALSVHALYAYLGRCMSNCSKGHIGGVMERLVEFTKWQIDNEDITKIPD